MPYLPTTYGDTPLDMRYQVSAIAKKMDYVHDYMNCCDFCYAMDNVDSKGKGRCILCNPNQGNRIN